MDLHRLPFAAHLLIFIFITQALAAAPLFPRRLSPSSPSPPSPSSPTLGIWNGHPVPPGSLPWLAALTLTRPPLSSPLNDAGSKADPLAKDTQSEEDTRQTPEAFCGASLISPTAALTAAHCLVDVETGLVSKSAMYLIFNTTDLSHVNASNVRKITSVRVHPKFGTKGADYDVGVAYFKDDPIPSSPPVSPSASRSSLPPPTSPSARASVPFPFLRLIDNTTSFLETPGTPVYNAGWGETQNVIAPTTATYVNTTIISLPACQALFPPPHWCCPWPNLTTNMVCAYDKSLHNMSDCNGDSGTPLFFTNASFWQRKEILNEKEVMDMMDGNRVNEGDGGNDVEDAPSFVQVGIASWGTLCGGPPDVYQRVLPWRQWIDEVVDDFPSY